MMNIGAASFAAAKAAGKVVSLPKISTIASTLGALAVAGLLTFARLYVLPVKRHDLPVQVRVAPAW